MGQAGKVQEKVDFFFSPLYLFCYLNFLKSAFVIIKAIQVKNLQSQNSKIFNILNML